VTGTSQLGKTGYIVFEFPPSIQLDPSNVVISVSPSSVSGILEVFRHVLVFHPSAAITASSLDFTLTGMNTAECQENRKVTISVVNNHYFLTQLTHTLTYPLPSPVDLTFTIEKTSNRYSGLLANYLLAITHQKNIPAGGHMTIDFPPEVNWAIKNVVIYSGLP
jgi:hypothetical protein